MAGGRRRLHDRSRAPEHQRVERRCKSSVGATTGIRVVAEGGSDRERLAIVARLKEGSAQRAAELVGAGPPFDLAGCGIARHSVYISSGEAVFVFEGDQ